MHAFQAVSSMYNKSLKFPNKVGICTIKGSQQIAQSCYMMSTYSSRSAIEARKKWEKEIIQNITPKYMLREEERVVPASHTEEIILNTNVRVRIGAQLKDSEKKEVVELRQC